MAILKKMNGILQKLKRDESGTAALSWALSLTAIIGAMGAAMDFAMLSSADGRAQTISDTTALAAAIYVKNNEVVPSDREKGLIGEYTAAELGYSFKNWVIKDGEKAPKVNVTYDNIAREATVVVTGYTRPTLVQILGFDDLAFKAETVVKYYEKDLEDPASIMMILDNSGSMSFDDMPIDPVTGLAPADATRRMDGLQAASIDFMNIIESAVGPQPQDGSTDLVVRTGMMAFDSGIVRTVPMDWGYIDDSEFTSMTPLLATNSAPPLAAANTWLNIDEPPIHEANLPGKTPLKYVVLMTDGKNSGDLVWVNRANTEQWRRWVTGQPTRGDLGDAVSETTTSPPVCTTEYVTVYYRQCDWSDGYQSRRKESSFRQPASGHSNYWNASWSCYSEEEQEADEVCVDGPTIVTWSGWEYYTGENPYDNDPGWAEGEFDVPANIASRAQCDSLHAAGVEVFTVGFALVAGQFETNEWADRPGAYTPYPSSSDPNWYENSVKSTNLAKGMLQYCASRDENFITADDVASLQTAFDRIGNTIIKEIVRISS